MEKPQIFRYVALVTPLVSVMCAMGLTIYEMRRLQNFQSEVTTTQTKISDVNRVINENIALPVASQNTTVDRGPHEQNSFLNSLRMIQNQSHVQITRLTNIEPPALAAPDPSSPTAARSVVMAAPISTSMEVVGKQNDVRQFLYRIQLAPRLMNMTDMKWLRDAYPTTHLIFTLTRYVAPSGSHPVLAPVEQTSAPSGQGAVIPVTQRTTADGAGISVSEGRSLFKMNKRPANGPTPDLNEKVNHILGVQDKTSTHGGASAPPVPQNH